MIIKNKIDVNKWFYINFVHQGAFHESRTFTTLS